jgi:hypothetical protein
MFEVLMDNFIEVLIDNFIVTLFVYSYILISLDDFNFIIFTIFLQIYRFLFLIL